MALNIVHQDLSTVAVDAVVLPSNPSLQIDGGAGMAVARIAGLESVQSACNQLGGCSVGQAKATAAFDFPARYLIHAVGPMWQGGKSGERAILLRTYESALELAASLGCSSVAVPLIGSGAFGFPANAALDVASDALQGFCRQHDIDVTLCLHEDKDALRATELYNRVSGFVDAAEQEGDRARARYGFQQPMPMPQFAEAAQEPKKQQRRFSMPSIKLPSFSRHKDEGTTSLSGRSSTETYDRAFEAEPDASFQALEAMPMAAPVQQTKYCGECGANIPDSAFFCPQCGSAQSAQQDSLEDLLSNLDASFTDTLFALIDASGMSDAEVYRRAGMSRQLFSKIRSNPDYRPKKPTVVSLCFALRLTLPQTCDLLSRAGYSLSRTNKYDIIVEYFIREGIYDMVKINAMLYAHDQELLGCK